MTLISDKISIIVPHLNQQLHLRKCLQSLKSQQGASCDIEIIVVDNGSQELPHKICEEFNNIILEQELRPGPGAARNKGVSVSTGNILAFIDADCRADAKWIATIEKFFRDNEATRVIGGDVRIAINVPNRLTMLEAYESIFSYRQQEYIEKQGFSGTGNLSMRRHCFDDVGPFAGIDTAEDRDWGQRARACGYVTQYVPEMIVFHPAREHFRELCTKWDRLIDHDFKEYGERGRLRWLLYTCVVSFSPVFEILRIFKSKRISTFGQKCLAFWGVVQIRVHRARRMLYVMTNGASEGAAKSWNRT